MDVWYAIPSANVTRANECFAKWKKMGYKTCVLIDAGKPRPDASVTDKVIEASPYEGYYKSLIRMAEEIGLPDAIVTGGDDIYPDEGKDAATIAGECYAKFPDGFFVMQPVGDKMDGVWRICASPWFGKGWLRRAYGGKHPVWPGYTAFFGDTELKEVAEKLRVLWQRPDLCQYHNHWCRPGGPKKTDYQAANDTHWKKDERLYQSRKRSGWPGMWPKPPGVE